jgi:hypothetical protein
MQVCLRLRACVFTALSFSSLFEQEVCSVTSSALTTAAATATAALAAAAALCIIITPVTATVTSVTTTAAAAAAAATSAAPCTPVFCRYFCRASNLSTAPAFVSVVSVS